MKKIILFLFFIILGIFFTFYFWQRLSFSPVNFLFLGIAGENHEGKDLTDTIIFASFHPQRGIVFLSLPRDIWLPNWRTKLNGIYHYKGLEETKKTIGEILGQKIDFGIVIDFELFKKIIDILGGIDVDVEKNFDDYRYPIAGKENDLCGGDPEFKCRYEHIHFEAGKQKMDGETALKFVRSRNAEGEEGTDFARAQRQQKVILAIKDKILSPEFLFSSGKPLQLIKIVTANIKSDIPKEKYWYLIKLGLKVRGKEVKTLLLNDNYLINPKNSKEKYDNQWVLIPKTGNWQEIQDYVKRLLNTNL